MLVTILCQFKSWKYFFQAEMSVWTAKFSCGCFVNHPHPRAFNSMEWTTLFRSLLASHEFFSICSSNFPMIDKCRCFFASGINSDSETFIEQHIPLLFIKKVWALQFLKYETKTFLVLTQKWFFSTPSRRWRFLAILVSDQEMSKLTFCFPILFFD